MFIKYFLNTLIAALVLACSLPVLSAEITYFYDGDTVKIKDANREFKLRITDIDAPELNQTYGKKSRRAIMQLCQNAQVQLQIFGIDKYQRNLGKLQCNQQDVSVFMVKNGHAWFNNRYSNDGNLAFLQQTAQQSHAGLWNNKKPTPPWQWRKNHPHMPTK